MQTIITLKPIIYVANVSEDDFSKGIENNQYIKQEQTSMLLTSGECLSLEKVSWNSKNIEGLKKLLLAIMY